LYAFGLESQTKMKVIIRSGEMGAYIKDSEDAGLWIDAYWGINDISKVVDVTGWLLYGVSRKLLTPQQEPETHFLGAWQRVCRFAMMIFAKVCHRTTYIASSCSLLHMQL
jgi:hypothetical protein